jgi:hypothetical protein
MRIALIFFATICISYQYGKAQAFTDFSALYGINHSYVAALYGGGVSLIDFDQDGLDDITLAQNTSPIHFYRNTGNGFEQVFLLPFNSGMVKQVAWIDFDNDGDLDFFHTVHMAPPKLYENDGNLNLTDISISAGLPISAHQTFGLAFGDYNRDSWIDFYICNYNFNDGVTNRMFMNNGNGTFSETTQSTGTSNNSYFTFMANFTDYDRDMWPDLIVVNDRIFINSHNYLYKNNGNSTFSDISFASNFGLNINSMSISPADYDLDGDLDYYISNTQSGNLLMKNNGGFFFDTAPQANITVNEVSWSATWLDFDNDRDEDIMVATAPLVGNPALNYFGLNLGNGLFSQMNGVGIQSDLSMSYGGARGDLNSDGYPDFVWNNSAPTFSKVYMNAGGSNNYASIELEGVFSNRDAIGVWIDCWINGTNYVRYTTGTESYLSQHSSRIIYGLGSANQIDSLQLSWPSGIVEMYYSLASNQQHYFKEGDSLIPDIQVIGEAIICAGDSVLLTTNDPDAYWNDGSQSNQFWATDGGNYFLSVEIENEYTLYSDTITVIINPIPLFEILADHPNCLGESNGSIQLIDVVATEPYTTRVNGEIAEFPLFNLSSGVYEVEIVDANNCVNTITTFLNEGDLINASIEFTDCTCAGSNDGTINVSFSGGLEPISFYINETLSELSLENLAPGMYALSWFDANSCGGGINVEILSPPALQITAAIIGSSGNDGSINLDIINGIPPFNVSVNNEAISLPLTDLSPGDYSFFITDANGCSIDTLLNVPLIISVDEKYSNKLNVYPLPFDAFLNIENGQQEWLQIDIYDITGKLYQYEFSNEDMIELNTSSLSDGMYLLRISNDKIHATYKIIKE